MGIVLPLPKRDEVSAILVGLISRAHIGEKGLFVGALGMRHRHHEHNSPLVVIWPLVAEKIVRHEATIFAEQIVR